MLAQISILFRISLRPSEPKAQAVLAKSLIRMVFPRKFGHR